MQVIVLADAVQKEEMGRAMPDADIIWIDNENHFSPYKHADAFIDLKFVHDEGRKALLAGLLPKPVIVNSVINTLEEINSSFIRINGWTTFLSSSLVEVSGNNKEAKQVAEAAFSLFNKKMTWLPDDAGFVTARVISMIINEAFIALSEGVSTKDEINTAMRLGTAYPYGPFEWAEKIGVKNILSLLNKLAETAPRYTPSELLVREALLT